MEGRLQGFLEGLVGAPRWGTTEWHQALQPRLPSLVEGQPFPSDLVLGPMPRPDMRHESAKVAAHVTSTLADALARYPGLDLTPVIAALTALQRDLDAYELLETVTKGEESTNTGE